MVDACHALGVVSFPILRRRGTGLNACPAFGGIVGSMNAKHQVCYVYILYSPSLSRYYTGISKHTRRRVKQHKSGNSLWTSRADDWKAVYREKTSDMKTAREKESIIKSIGARRYLDRIKGVT